jgi:hypothetical protein
MPSRAFCSDESQGYPIILITKHFNTFPFNHGMVGGVVATDRHGPHADHGKDLVIIQASHVGYNHDTSSYGVYRRVQTENDELSACCGKVDSVLSWYQNEYHYARENTFAAREKNQWTVTVDNQILNIKRGEGVHLHLDKLIRKDDNGQFSPIHAYSTSRCYLASAELAACLDKHPNQSEGRQPLGERLQPEWFFYKKEIEGDEEGQSHLEANLYPVMPWVITSPSPLLAAAKVNTQVEFDAPTTVSCVKRPTGINASSS